ncbi:helix-turn-helix domain-containing protein [Eggerthellaceae bacterium zg-887]|uniref:helix-turn-helix domain-containing protein n=1 Tax=Xiamenia xianingshaonis TaxID=2682776 RepID=UPI0013ED1A64|nr:helix-turn-helix domain-containing protein [Xiamenia xianingshaonis]NGM18033.1 helix-turn-helix domain-containing protein [Eggerthellaceae bacterium zg-893]NHM16443.1 helix-turn-helix domain-containing protein [Xiamenia xianingshaonis]
MIYGKEAHDSRQEVSAPVSMENDLILSDFPQVGTIEDVANAMQLKPAAVRQLCREGKLAAIKCGTLWRVPRPWLEEFILKGGCHAG